MKKVRFWIIASVGTVALAALMAMAVLSPAVQRWAVLELAGGRPGSTLELERVAIRPGIVEIHNLRAEQTGMRVVIPDATFEISLWQALVHRRLVLGNARVNGLKLDLSPVAQPPGRPRETVPENSARAVAAGHGVQPMPGSDSVSPPAATMFAWPHFDGVFRRLELPYEVVLDSCDVDADMLIPRAAGPPTEARVKLTGGHFGPGQEARFNFEAAISHPGPHSPVEMIEARGVLTATLGRPTVIERLGVHIDATATGPLLSAPARLQADALLARTPTGETYSVSLNSSEGGAVNRLLALDGDYVAGSSRLTGSWHVQANNRDVAPFALGMPLPDFSVSGDGHFGANFTTLDVSLAGRLAGDANRLEIVDSRLRELGTLGVAAAFNVDFHGGELRVTEFGVDINEPSPMLSMHAVQPFTVNLKSGATTAADATRELVQITLDGVPAKWVRPLFPGVGVSGGEINGKLVAALHGTGQMWLRTASPLSIRGFTMDPTGWIALQTTDIKLDAEVEYSAGATRVWVRGLNLTTLAGDRLDGRGELTLKPGKDSPDVSVKAEFETSLPTLLDGCVPVGGLTARGVVALSHSGEMVQVDRITAQAVAADGHLLLDLASREAFRISLADRQVTCVGGGPGELLQVKFGRVPLRLTRAGHGGLQVAAEVGEGQCVVRTDANGLRVDMPGQLRLEGLSAGVGDRAWLNNVAVEVAPALAYSSHGALIGLTELRIKNAAGETILSTEASLTADVDLENPKCRGTASFDLSLPAMAGQPFLSGLEPPRQGKLAGNVKFSLDENLLAEGQLTLNGLVSSVSGEALPVANISFRAGLDDKGEIAVQAPILIDRAGERSDLTFAATLRPAAEGRAIDARLTSDHLVLDDLLLLARALPAAAAPPAGAGDATVMAAAIQARTAAPVNPAAQVAPAWAGLVGLVQLDLRSIIYGHWPEVVRLEGRALIESQRLAAENVRAAIGKDGGQIRFSGEVRFGSGDPQPYKSKLDLEVKAFELGLLFKMVDPDKPPTIEGRFDVRAHADGAGQTLINLAANTGGNVVLQSRKGISRLLQRPPSAPVKSAGIVSTVANTAVRVIDNIGETVGKIVSNSDATDEIAGMLSEVQFDQLHVSLSRDPLFNTRLAEFSLVSPVVRLQGNGLITNEPGKPLFAQSLKLTLSMGVMGTVEKAMADAKAPMLSTDRDELGYRKTSEIFDVVGSLDKPDPALLYTMVARSTIGKLLH